MPDVGTVNCRFGGIDDIHHVLRIHKKCKKTLGALPDAVFKDALVDRELIVGEKDGAVVGYVLFSRRATNFDIRITHLAVDPNMRRSRSATAMIDFLSAEESERERIVCSVRSDFEGARSFWELNRFEATADRRGRATSAPSELKVYVRPLALPLNLFDAEFEHSMRVPVHVDLNILIDLITEREAGSASRRLFANLLESEIQPVRTTALMNELADHEPIDERNRARSVAMLWPQAEVETDRAAPNLKDQFPEVEEKDRRYLAEAHGCGQPILVTRDEPFLAAAPTAAKLLGVRLVDPITYEHSIRQDARQDSAVGWSELSISRASDQNIASLLKRFVNHSSGERKVELRQRLEAAFANPDVETFCVSQKTEPVAMFSISRDESRVTVGCLRAVAGWRTPVMARRLLSEIRSKALDGSSPLTPVAIEVDDEYADRTLGQAARAQSIDPNSERPLLLAVAGAATASELVRLVQSAVGDRADLQILESLADEPWELETVLEPVFVTDPTLPAYLIPIRGGWADRLVGASSVNPNLIGRDPSLARSSENVYFCGKKMKLQVPARLLWYRSHDSKSIYAASIIRGYRFDKKDRVWAKFGSSGVLTLNDLTDIGDANDNVLAVKFDRTRVFEQEVGIDAAGLFPPQSLQSIDGEKAVEIVAKGVQGVP